MSEIERNHYFCEQLPEESSVMLRAREVSKEYGINCITKAQASYIASVAAMTKAKNIAEIGTGVGYTSLCLLQSNEKNNLSGIEQESEYVDYAKKFFREADINSNRVRLIVGNPKNVLPRMNENSYDLVLVGGKTKQIVEYAEHALRLCRPGGTVIIPHILNNSKVSNPVIRDSVTVDYRTIIGEIIGSNAVISSVLPIGDGIATITRIS